MAMYRRISRVCTFIVAGGLLLGCFSVGHPEPGAPLGGSCDVSSSPLVKAATSGDLASVASQVKSYGVDTPDSLGRTALYCAAARDRADAVTALLDAGATADLTSTVDDASVSADRDFPIGIAAEHGNVTIVAALLDKNASADPPGQILPTPLDRATKTGTTAVVRALLDAGANPNFAVGTAATNNRAEFVGWMIDKGANPVLALGSAAQAGHDDIVKLALDRRADVNGGEGGPSPVLWAAFNSRRSTVRLLLDRGANPDHGGLVNPDLFATAVDAKNASASQRVGLPSGTLAQNVPPLLAAAASGDVDIVTMLIDAGADVNLAAYGRFTSLHGAAVGASVPVVNALLDAGANPTLVGGAITPAQLASQLGNPAVARALDPAANPTTSTSR